MTGDGKDFFLEESRDLLATLETALLSLEKDPETKASIHDVFRSLHTIKGSGAMFGFDDASKFAHQVEYLFDDIRKGTVPISPEAIAIGLRAKDCIQQLLESEAPQDETEAIVTEIRKIRGTTGKEPTEKARLPSAESEIAASPRRDTARFAITIVPQEDVLYRGVKFEAAFALLETLGKYECSANAERIPDLDQINPEMVYLSWSITLETSAIEDEALRPLEFIREYAEVRIARLDAPAAATVEEPIEERPFHAKLEKKPQEKIPSLPGIREPRAETGFIKVRRDKLDLLFNAIGELVILQAQLSRESGESSHIVQSIAEQLERLTVTLRDHAMYMRMVPIEESFSGLQRVVHDTAKRLGKDVKLEIIGANTEIDKNVIESLKDALIHIIRNSIDHGIEQISTRLRLNKPSTGTITISACQIGTSVQIVISDDGAGLNIEKIKAKAIERKLIDKAETDISKIIQVIFEPGFSTSERTTSLSGRGVGMDVVRMSVDRLQGDIAITTEQGRGTAITLTIPLTLLITDCLLVRIGGIAYVLALNLVQECLCLDDCVASGIAEHDVLRFRGKMIPLIDLHERLLREPGEITPDARAIIATIEGNDVALVVDMIEGKQQVVIKPFTAPLEAIPIVSGATILGDGSVALILNTSEIIKRWTYSYAR
jgi:two-component system, chemotaxis family, sensor kinase CheA